jgi:hypothetical protein
MTGRPRGRAEWRQWSTDLIMIAGVSFTGVGQRAGLWHSGAMTAARRDHRRSVSAFLASYNDIELAVLMATGRADSVGVGGGSVVLDVDGVPMFAKRIPLTDRELANPGSTANLFDLPVYCQYGVVSPGFNAWRELTANTIVSDAVLAGETQSFPLLYHWRVLPGRSPVAAEHADIDTVVAALGGCPAVCVRLEALATASHGLVLFCEYIPHPMVDWLRENPVGKATTVERQFAHIVKVLRGRQLLHMDGHLANMRARRGTDLPRRLRVGHLTAVRPVSRRTRLRRTPRHPRCRLRRHATGQLAGHRRLRDTGADQRWPGRPVARNEYVLQCAAGHIPDDVPPAVAAILTRYAPAATKMNALYWKLFDGELHAEYPDL